MISWEVQVLHSQKGSDTTSAPHAPEVSASRPAAGTVEFFGGEAAANATTDPVELILAPPETTAGEAPSIVASGTVSASGAVSDRACLVALVLSGFDEAGSLVVVEVTVGTFSEIFALFVVWSLAASLSLVSPTGHFVPAVPAASIATTWMFNRCRTSSNIFGCDCRTCL